MKDRGIINNVTEYNICKICKLQHVQVMKDDKIISLREILTLFGDYFDLYVNQDKKAYQNSQIILIRSYVSPEFSRHSLIISIGCGQKEEETGFESIKIHKF